MGEIRGKMASMALNVLRAYEHKHMYTLEKRMHVSMNTRIREQKCM